jgi:hypothetical protein
MSQKLKLSRRAMLRGMGAAVSLPLLDAMPAMADATRLVRTSTAPLRMAFLFVPNGVNLDCWTPQRDGYGFDLPPILEPLERVQDDILVLSGLTHDKGRANGDGPGDHARSASVFLTGCQAYKTSGGNIRVGVSVDQIAARHIGSATRFPSLELGCDKSRNSGNCDSGYSCAYSYNISWASPTTPMAKEIDPRLVFERLFGDSSAEGRQAAIERSSLRKSLLDYVRDDAQRLRDGLGKSDQRKLEEYLTAIREIERRVELVEHQTQLEAPTSFAKPAGIPSDFGTHVRLMTDMLVLAFQTDSTRIATCMLAHEGSNRNYTEIEVPDGHHDLSHHGGNKVKLEKIARINRFHMEQFAYFVERLKSIPEGEGSLLDNCMIVYGSGISDGNRHNRENLPVLVAGRGGGTIETGRHVRYETETPMTNLYVSMLERMGIPLDRVGDSTGPLPFLA